MTPPLPIRLTGAQLRLVGVRLDMSVHGFTVQTELQPTTLEAMWAQLGAKQNQVTVEIRGESAGAELVRLNGRQRGIRMWVGKIAVHRPLVDRYWDFFYQAELGKSAAEYQEAEHVA